MSKHNTITEAQHAIMEELKLLGKDKEGFDYLYTSAAFATTMIRPLLIKHGVSRTKIKSENKGRWQNGVGVDIHAVYRYMLVGTEEPKEFINYIDVQVDGSGKAGKSGDKSMYAAATTAGKYADLDFLYLPMVEDVEQYDEIVAELEDAYNKEDEDPQPRKAKRAQEPDEQPEPPRQTKKKKRLKVNKPAPEPEPEPEEVTEQEIPSNSSELNYNEGVFTVIEAIYEQEGIEAVLDFTEGDTRNKVEDLVEELKEDAGWYDEEGEPEPEIEDEPEEDEQYEEEAEGVDLNELDYNDPDVQAAIGEQIDLEDDEMIRQCLDSFTDGDQLTMFYTTLLEHAQEVSQDFADSFNEEHFDYLQELYEELED